MIVYALIVRTKDGMALSATTDFNDEINKSIKESKRYVKIVAKKASQFPDRCILNLSIHTLHFITALGVTYLVLCNSSYPPVLAFSFLNELMREFITKYETVRVNMARRPYSFIEFDNFIHKTRQRYNKPQSLTTRVNLSELSVEIKLRPPHELSINEVEPIKNGYHTLTIPRIAVGPPPKLQPLLWYHIMSMIPTFLFAFLGFYRGFSALSYSTLEEYDGPNPSHGFMFLFESCLRLLQIFLLIYHVRYRITGCWICFVLLLFSTWCVWDLRDTWQRTLFLTSAFVSHFMAVLRKVQLKLPDYLV
uniref:Longin domain-containing protein n=1 Tax=Clastoptera arizonana TaxID=38151 RepID=A0A1B6DKY2_9HEMI